MADGHRRRLLLSEGSSLSARQAITVLGLAGHEIEICDPDPLAIGRFSRFVRRFHRCPGLGTDPEGYLSFVLDLVSRQHFDALLPIHEQAYLFAKARARLAPHVALALPSFASFEQVQSKAAFTRLLTALDLPQPPTTVIRSARELLAARRLPCVVKMAIGTASRSIWMVDDAAGFERVAAELDAIGAFDDEVLVQDRVEGPLERAQAVFCRAQLVGFHGYRQIAVGAGGGDRIKESVCRPMVRAHLARLGEHLAWHGALSVDYILDEKSGVPLYIDGNPRLVEPVNALLSGTDLATLLVQVSEGQSPAPLADGRNGVRTHMAIPALLRCAIESGSRRALFAEALGLLRGRAPYADSREELTPLGWDWLSAVPLILVAFRLLAKPDAAKTLATGTARSHQLNLASVRAIRTRIAP